MVLPRGNRRTDDRADALHRLKLSRIGREDRTWISAEILKKTIERNRSDIRERVQNQKRLPLGQFAAHSVKLWERLYAAIKIAGLIRLATLFRFDRTIDSFVATSLLALSIAPAS